MIDFALFRDVLKSEWTKLRSVRSTYWSLLATIVLGVGLGAAISAGNAHAYSHESLSDRLTFDPTAFSLAGFFFAQLALGVFAILAMSAEYSTGTIRTTISAVPQRGYILAAKAVLVTVVSVVVSLGIAFSAFSIGQLIFRPKHLDVSLGDPGVLRAVLGSGLAIGALVLFAIGLATVIRHTAGAISALVVVFFVLPIITGLLPGDWQHDFGRYLPADSGHALTSVVRTQSLLSPAAGALMLVLWTVLSLAVGWVALRRRDV